MVLNVHTETTRLIRDGEKCVCVGGGGGGGGMAVGEETLLCHETIKTLKWLSSLPSQS